jgi:hypothetical protein
VQRPHTSALVRAQLSYSTGHTSRLLDKLLIHYIGFNCTFTIERAGWKVTLGSTVTDPHPPSKRPITVVPVVQAEMLYVRLGSEAAVHVPYQERQLSVRLGQITQRDRLPFGSRKSSFTVWLYSD